MTKEMPDWWYRQSAVVPYRRGTDGLEVLLITSRRRKRWVLPKGVIEPDMTPSASAAKEGWEEAGVEGTVDDMPIGVYEYNKWGGTCTVHLFLMAVTKEATDWPEAASRSREWVSLDEAKRRLDEEDLRALLHMLPSLTRN
jgi:8-oxo-dGTP pyrophosphatase MutT (NUDIX family)